MRDTQETDARVHKLVDLALLFFLPQIHFRKEKKRFLVGCYRTALKT
jgi:hypothetical protein